MRRVISICAITIILVACASRYQQAIESAVEEPEPLSHPRVEIFYEAKPQLVVLDTGVTPTAGFGGLFGPVGALVTIGIDAASRSNSINQVESRSKRFQQAVQESVGELTLHREYAEQLAQAMRATGREVKLTPSGRPTGSARKMALAGVEATPGYEVMLLRISTSYDAPAVTSDYWPAVVVDYALHDDKLRPITWNSFTARPGKPTYFSFDALMKDNKAAYDGLRQALFSTVAKVMENDFPKQGE